MGWMECGSGQRWWPGAPCSGRVLLGRASNADPRILGLPAPTAPAFADEAERRKGPLLALQQRRAGSAHSGVHQAQAGPSADGPRGNSQGPLLECTESEPRAQSWRRPRHSCSSRAQAVLQGSTHWKTGWHLPWAATGVPAEARGVLGSYPQSLREAQADQGAEETLVGLGLAKWVGCFWIRCPAMCFGAPVY